MTTLHPLQIVKRLEEASGYLELGLPRNALERLEPVQNAGQFEAAAQFLRGHALRADEQYDRAAISLTTAACLLPAALQRQVLNQAFECYERAGLPCPIIEADHEVPPKSQASNN